MPLTTPRMVNLRDSCFAGVTLFSSVVPCPETQCRWLKSQVITHSHLLVVTYSFVLYQGSLVEGGRRDEFKPVHDLGGRNGSR